MKIGIKLNAPILPEEFVPISGSTEEVAAALDDHEQAGADLVQVLVDPQTPAAVEQLAEAVDRYRRAAST